MILTSDGIILPWHFRIGRSFIAFKDVKEMSLLKGRLGPRLVLRAKQGGRVSIDLLDFEDESGASKFLETLVARSAREPNSGDTRPDAM